MNQETPGLHYLRTFRNFELGNVSATEAFGLSRVLALLEEVGSPHLHLPAIHLAGTKGKGSTAAMLASILQAAGYRTGLFTQPHLLRMHERFQIDGVPIADGDIDSIMLDEIRPAIARLELRGIGDVQQFEAQTALALLWFMTREVDAVVLETGLGGRLDATNVVPHPLATVITPIGYDHMQVLGTTLPLIAAEKAAIIKPEVPTVASPQPVEAMEVIERACAAASAPLLLGDREWRVDRIAADLSGTRFTLSVGLEALKRAGVVATAPFGDDRGEMALVLPDLQSALLGAHQAINAGAAVVTAMVIAERFPRLTAGTIQQGLAHVRWPGRLQILAEHPAIVLDGAHTAESAAALATAMQTLFGGRRLILVCGVQADKDIPAVVGPLAPLASVALATEAPHPRAAGARVIGDALRAAGAPRVEEVADPLEALDRARALAGPEDVILITGSLYLVGAILAGESSRHIGRLG